MYSVRIAEFWSADSTATDVKAWLRFEKKKVAKEADRKAKKEQRNDVHCKKKVASKKFLKENMIHCLTKYNKFVYGNNFLCISY